MVKNRIYGQSVDLDENEVARFWKTRTECQNRLRAILLGDDFPISSLEKRNQVEFELLSSFLTFDKPFSILDIGCGTARWADNFKDMYSSYTGIDLTEDFIVQNKARFENDDRCRFYTMSASALEPIVTDNKYDLIIVTGVMMYINDDSLKELFSNISEMSQKNGMVYLQESVSMLDTRLTLDRFDSETLKDSYSAIYRTIPEYDHYFRESFSNMTVIKTGNLLTDETCARQETNAHYWFMENKIK